MRKSRRELSHITVGDIFDDRDLFTAEEGALLKVKSALMDAIQADAKRKGFSQSQLGATLKEYQPNVSNLLHGKISKFSIDKLVRYATRLGLQIEVGVVETKSPLQKPSRRKNGRAAA